MKSTKEGDIFHVSTSLISLHLLDNQVPVDTKGGSTIQAPLDQQLQGRYISQGQGFMFDNMQLFGGKFPPCPVVGHSNLKVGMREGMANNEKDI